MILGGLELCLRKRVVIGHVRPTVRPCDPQIEEQLADALRSHRRPTVGVQGQLLAPDVLSVAGLADQHLGQLGTLARRDHPPDDIAAEDVEYHIKVEGRSRSVVL
jgi:hypothetical protein